MRIGELADLTGLTPSRIRFYERIGLLQMVERAGNGYRSYPEDAVLILNLIILAQNAGFSLDELRQLLPTSTVEWEHNKLEQALRDKVRNIENLQQHLEQSKATILTILGQMGDKPSDMTCAANARRVLANIQLSESPLRERLSVSKQLAKNKKV